MARGRIARDRRDGRVTDREALDRALANHGHPAHERVLSLQQQAGNRAIVQRFREYDEVAANGTTNVGKLVNGAGLHYTVVKPKELADHFSEFHVTYHRAVQGKHPHFYFTDAGDYRPSGEKTKQNQEWIGLAGQQEFDELKADAPAKAQALLTRPGFPAYEGATVSAVNAAHAKKAADAEAAAKDAANEAAGIKSVVATTSKVKPKKADCDKFAAALKESAGATTATAAAKGNAMVATLVFADYKSAKDAQLALSKQVYNTKPIVAELGST